MERGGSVYILTNKNNSTLYIGVTSNLLARISEHRNKRNSGSFSSRYNLDKLVYYENFHQIEEAIMREKQLKGWIRAKKNKLVNSINPEWNDLFDNLI